MDWSSGYVADINYTYGYYPGLNPLNMKLALLFAGIKPPKIKQACELGYGQGISINFHSAATSVAWSGNDFNPAHTSFANEVNLASGSSSYLSEDDFERFCAQSELPDFDFIGLHGVWSWISEANRSLIIDFIGRKLRVGGVVYLSYNSQNAWASMIPLRDLMTYYANVMEPSGSGRIGGINGALKFAEKLEAVNPKFFKANNILKTRLAHLKNQSREYLAHEYFNRDWEAINFARLNESFSEAKLSYAAPANHLDAIDKLNLTKSQRELLAEVTDPVLYQVVRDFCVNSQFRAEYWVKGPRKLSAIERRSALEKIRIILIHDSKDVSLQTRGDLGEAKLSETISGPILNYLADHKPRYILEIEEELKGTGIDLSMILQTVMVLIGKRSLGLAQEKEEILKAKDKSDRTNKYLIEHAYGSKNIGYLVSPVTGGGIPCSRIEKLFIAAKQSGMNKPMDLAEFAWAIISSQNESLLKNGKKISNPKDSINFLTNEAKDFDKKQLPVLKALFIL